MMIPTDELPVMVTDASGVLENALLPILDVTWDGIVADFKEEQ